MRAGNGEVRVFGPARIVLVAAGISLLLFLAGLIFNHVRHGWNWVTLGFAGLTVIGVLGFVETATTRIVLTDAYLEAGSIWRRRRYAPAEIESVTWEKGAGVVLKLASGRWAKLPGAGSSAQGLTNSIRAWLKRHHAA